MSVRTHIMPCLRYADAPAAIDFLVRAFGFSVHADYRDEADANIVHHAELVMGEAMVMLGSARPSGIADLYGWKTPAEAGGVTMSICMVIADPDAHHAGAAAAGAHILTEPHDNQGYPGRAYDARDPEGNVWNFGSYDPWAGK